MVDPARRWVNRKIGSVDKRSLGTCPTSVLLPQTEKLHPLHA